MLCGAAPATWPRPSAAGTRSRRTLYLAHRHAPRRRIPRPQRPRLARGGGVRTSSSTSASRLATRQTPARPPCSDLCTTSVTTARAALCRTCSTAPGASTGSTCTRYTERSRRTSSPGGGPLQRTRLGRCRRVMTLLVLVHRPQ